MKKFISVGLIVLFTLFLIGCSDKEEPENEVERAERLLDNR